MNKGWYGNSQKHSLANKGIRSSLKKSRMIIYSTKKEIYDYIKTFKNENAKKYAIDFMKTLDKKPYNMSVNFSEKSIKLVFTPIANERYYEDKHGNTWEEIKIYDKQNNFIRGMRKYATSGFGIGSGKSKKIIKFLEDIEENIMYEETFSRSHTFVKIYYIGNSINDLNLKRKSVDNKLNKEFKINAFNRDWC